jgi:hypothetical protein
MGEMLRQAAKEIEQNISSKKRQYQDMLSWRSVLKPHVVLRDKS